CFPRCARSCWLAGSGCFPARAVGSAWEALGRVPLPCPLLGHPRFRSSHQRPRQWQGGGIAESGVEPTGRRVGCKMSSTSQRGNGRPFCTSPVNGLALPWEDWDVEETPQGHTLLCGVFPCAACLLNQRPCQGPLVFCLLARKWGRTNYLQRPRRSGRNIARRTLGQAAAAIGKLRFSTRYDVLDYEYHQRGSDDG